jgi:hypothetical protein
MTMQHQNNFAICILWNIIIGPFKFSLLKQNYYCSYSLNKYIKFSLQISIILIDGAEDTLINMISPIRIYSKRYNIL